jgi:hypothetical protein
MAITIHSDFLTTGGFGAMMTATNPTEDPAVC